MNLSVKRVVVTGFGGITALGHDWPTIERALRNNVSGIARMDEWDRFIDLNTRLGGPVPKFELPPQYTRKVTRTMGRVALLATRATEMALENAGLLDDPVLGSGKMGVAYGSCTGSPDAIREFGSMIETGDVGGHAPARAAYESLGFQRWPVARYFKSLDDDPATAQQ